MREAQTTKAFQQRCAYCESIDVPVCAHNKGSADALVGSSIGGRYRVRSLIGSGGWGFVYECEHISLGTLMAVKVLHPAHMFYPNLVERFQREAQALIRLNHPNICRIFDLAETDDGRPCIAMELVTGESLNEYIKAKQKLSPKEAVSIGKQMCDALGSAHRQGIIHRDLKPANVMITSDGVVKILDFGLARGIEDNELSLTDTGQTVGTPFYMSPEQCRGDVASAQWDIYAIGCILFEMLAGERVASGSTTLGVMHSQLNEAPRLDKLPRHESLRAIVDRALDKDPSRRYKSTADISSALSAVFSDIPNNVDYTSQLGLVFKSHRKRLAIAAVNVFVVSGIGIYAWTNHVFDAQKRDMTVVFGKSPAAAVASGERRGDNATLSIEASSKLQKIVELEAQASTLMHSQKYAAALTPASKAFALRKEMDVINRAYVESGTLYARAAQLARQNELCEAILAPLLAQCQDRFPVDDYAIGLALHLRGANLYLMRDYDAAIKVFTEAMPRIALVKGVGDRYESCCLRLSDCYVNTNRKKDAEDMAELAVAVSKRTHLGRFNTAMVRANLALCAAANGHPEKARTEADTALGIITVSPNPRQGHWIGAHWRLKNYYESINDQNALSKLNAVRPSPPGAS